MHEVITISNNDTKLWNIAKVSSALTRAMLENKDICAHLNGEGPCATSLGLYNLLDYLCQEFNYNKSRITIVTANMLEAHDEYDIQRCFNSLWLTDFQELAKIKDYTQKKITKTFGHFIGHGSRFRLILASYLWARYQEQTMQTYHCVPTEAYHREFVCLEDILFHRYDLVHFENACKMLQHTPFTFDIVESYPLLHKKMYIILDAYKDIFVDIVNLTYVSGNTFYIDEKIWRPILSKTPFMIHGPQNFLVNFKRLGFKTFSQWWDEGYSEDPPDVQVTAIINNIDRLAKLSLSELEAIYNDMIPILEHNYKRLLELTPEDVKKVFT